MNNLKRWTHLLVFTFLIAGGLVGYFADKAIGDTPLLSVPGAPYLQVTSSQSSYQIAVSWKESASGQGGNIKGYEVSRSTNGTDFSVVQSADTASFTLAQDTLTFTDTVNATSGKYYYRVRAYDAAGNFSGPSPASATYVTGPKVVGTTPTSGASNVSLGTSVQIQFDQEIDPASVNPANISLKIENGTTVPGTILTYDSAHNLALISIPAKLLPNKKYQIIVSKEVSNISTFKLLNSYSTNFTTTSQKSTVLSTPSSTNQNPHGNYDISTQLCSSCHTSHSAVGPNLIKASTNNDLCLVCHNGTQASQIGDFSPSNFQSYGHYEGSNPANKSDCTICHTPHGSQWEKTLKGPYPINIDYSRTSFEQSQFFCITCHKEFNNLNQVSTTSFNNQGEDLHYLHLNSLGGWGEGAAVCYECHRPHGSIASEIEGASQDSSLLGKVNLVGFPSASVQPAPGYTSPIFSPQPNGGGCNLNCHGVIHSTNLTGIGDVYSQYVKK